MITEFWNPVWMWIRGLSSCLVQLLRNRRLIFCILSNAFDSSERGLTYQYLSRDILASNKYSINNFMTMTRKMSEIDLKCSELTGVVQGGYLYRLPEVCCPLALPMQPVPFDPSKIFSKNYF